MYVCRYACMYVCIIFTSMLNTLLLLKPCMCTQPIAGEFIGFTNLGDINTHIANFKAVLESGTVPTKPLAKSMLVFMVRGLNSGLQFPYVQFPCDSLHGDQLFHLVWRVIGRLQRFGFHVMGLTGNHRHYTLNSFCNV